jgi:hypothetical protein
MEIVKLSDIFILSVVKENSITEYYKLQKGINKYHWVGLDGTQKRLNASFADANEALRYATRYYELKEFKNLADFSEWFFNEIHNWEDDESVQGHYDHLESIDLLLTKHNMSMSTFIENCKKEEMLIYQINDIDYIEDRMDVWSEMRTSNESTDYDQLELLFYRGDVLNISKFIIKHKLSVQEVVDYFENLEKFNKSITSFHVAIEDVVDTILGLLYDNIRE